MDSVYAALREANAKPAPFSVMTTETLWTDAHISAQMLHFHLHPDLAPASRPAAVISTLPRLVDAAF